LDKLPLKINSPGDYTSFVGEQKKYIEKELNGNRMMKKDNEFFLKDIYLRIKNKINIKESKQEINKESQHGKLTILKCNRK
jgi:hypothetical protein